jgi:hypothetical protein
MRLFFPIWMLSLIAGSAFGQSLPTDALDEMEAKLRFEARGYSNVHGLHKSSFGTWHATATKNGKSLNLGLDVQGHVGIE